MVTREQNVARISSQGWHVMMIWVIQIVVIVVGPVRLLFWTDPINCWCRLLISCLEILLSFGKFWAYHFTNPKRSLYQPSTWLWCRWVGKRLIVHGTEACFVHDSWIYKSLVPPVLLARALILLCILIGTWSTRAYLYCLKCTSLLWQRIAEFSPEHIASVMAALTVFRLNPVSITKEYQPWL